MKKTLLSLLLLFFNSVHGQNIYWEKCFGGTLEDRLHSSWIGHSKVIRTSDGNYVVAGFVKSNDGNVTSNAGMQDFWIIKFSPGGALLWQKSYGGSADDNATQLIETSDGGLFVVGHTSSNDGDITNYQGAIDAWVIKLDAAGNKQWQKTYGGTGSDIAAAVVQDGNSYVIAGNSSSNDGDVTGHHGGSWQYDIWVFKIDLSGTLLWQRSLGGSLLDKTVGIIKSSDNHYVICGTTVSNDGDVASNTHAGNGYSEMWVVKLTQAGNKVFEKCYGGSSQELGQCLIEDTDSNYVFLSTSASNDGDVTGHHGGTLSQDYWVGKVNRNSGALLWQKSLGGSGEDIPYEIALTSAGDYIIQGYTYSGDGDVGIAYGDRDYWIVKMSTSQTILWNAVIGTNSDEWGHTVIEESSGCYIAGGAGTGKFSTLTHGGYDWWFLKVCESPVIGNGTYNNGSFVVCGSSASLTAGMASTYNWTGPSFTASTNSIVTTSAGVYTLSTTTGTSAAVSQTFNLILNPIAALTVAATSTAICAGKSATLTAGGTGVTSYSWSSGSTAASIAVSPTANIVYTIIANPSLCPTSQTIALQVKNCTGIGEYTDRQNISVYPNPNTGNFIISSLGDAEVVITDLTGRVIQNITLSGQNQYNVDINFADNGVYLARSATGACRIVVTR